MKNKITNILGLIFWGFAIKELLEKEMSITYITSLVVIGGVLFLFSNKTLKNLLKGLVKSNNDIVRDVASTVDPDREYPDERG